MPDFSYFCDMEENFFPDFAIRQAESTDAPFVAKCVLAAVNLYDFKTDSIEKDVAEYVCGRDDTLYSWRNARIATIAGEAVGCMVSYPGDIYAAAREITFGIFKDAGREMTNTEIETGPGEWYLDSMAVVPKYCGYGIGQILMMDSIDIARRHGYQMVTLIVECNKPRLRDYYAGLGFEPEREIDAFGDRYLKMSKTKF